MLIIGGSFGTEPDPAFSGVNPAHWYVASYLTVVIAATGLVIVPVHLASYRERGVLRRFAAAGFPRWSIAFAQLAVELVTIAVASVLLLLVAAPVYGIPAMHESWRVVSALVLGAMGFVSGGVLLGSTLPSARAAQAVGLKPILSVVSARRRRAAAAGHGIGSTAGGRRASADPGHQRRAQSVSGIGVGHRVPDAVDSLRTDVVLMDVFSPNSTSGTVLPPSSSHSIMTSSRPPWTDGPPASVRTHD
jgi:hypothetical protein